MGRQISILKHITISVFILWTLLMTLFLITQKKQLYDQAEMLALNEAKVNIKKDLAYRSWVTSHGGVYVPITRRTPPNPYLSHIPNRDVKTDDGQQLTLMNPAYTLFQMMSDYANNYGTKGHLTSKKLLNPKNKPDQWESKVLNIVDKTKKAHNEIQLIDGQPHLRLLNPLITETGCLKCHGHQGYKEGDVRGGVSVSIPLTPYYDSAYSHFKPEIVFIIIIWFFGSSVITFGYNKIHQYVSEKIANYEQHIFSLVDMIENRDSYTAGHTNRVAQYSSLIAKEMGYNEDSIDKLYRASMVHDIGKISTPDSILLKPGKLSTLEYKLIQEHVSTGYQLLKKVDIFHDIAEIVRHHHEFYNGSGYPQGLKGDQIPMLSQIMTVADAFDAMTTNRIYKGKKTLDASLAELQTLAGKQFNTQVVQAAIVALKNIEIPDSNQQPRNQIEQERFAYFYKDQLTSAYNRDYLNYILIAENDNHPDDAYQCINLFYTNHLSQYNKSKGWNQGNQLLIKIANEMFQLFPDGFIFRIYGDDFAVLHKQHYEIDTQLNQLNSIFNKENISFTHQHVNLELEGIDSVDDLDSWLLNG
ncbi:MAG: DUF3365 domain-containing protein [Gammaproteobacteria bacterium]|nr:DUF3365 domain-containing protein [Gammaproteobacteria bacterium]